MFHERNVDREYKLILWVSTAAVLTHLGVVLLHGAAHSGLRVALSAWQKTYVDIVILVAPLIAMVLIWTRRVRLGLFTLLVSMAGSLIFGGYYHYIHVSPDHVSHLPPGDAQGLFRVTALLLLCTELFGVVAALFGLRRLR